MSIIWPSRNNFISSQTSVKMDKIFTIMNSENNKFSYYHNNDMICSYEFIVNNCIFIAHKYVSYNNDEMAITVIIIP